MIGRRGGTAAPPPSLPRTLGRGMPDVHGMEWAQFADYFGRAWKQGEHVAFIGPTGEGKSTTAAAILGLRRFVLALDPKGGDSTLAATGYERLTGFGKSEQRMIGKRIENGEPARFIVGPIVHTREDMARQRPLFKHVLTSAFEQGGWTVYVDELQVLADRRLMNLGGDAEALLIAARDKGVSFVSSYQRPANVPRTASDQAKWMVTFYTRDTDVVGRLAEMAGQSKAVMRGAVQGLGEAPYTCLVFSNKPRLPIIVTRAPELR